MQFLGNVLSVLYLAAYLAAGLRYAWLLLPREDNLTRAAAGASLALFAQMWLPALFSFLLGFTLLSQVLGLALFVLPCALPPVFRAQARVPSHGRAERKAARLLRRPGAAAQRRAALHARPAGPWTARCTRASPATGT